MMKQGKAGGVRWSAVCQLGPRRFEAALLFWFFLVVDVLLVALSVIDILLVKQDKT